MKITKILVPLLAVLTLPACNSGELPEGEVPSTEERNSSEDLGNKTVAEQLEATRQSDIEIALTNHSRSQGAFASQEDELPEEGEESGEAESESVGISGHCGFDAASEITSISLSGNKNRYTAETGDAIHARLTGNQQSLTLDLSGEEQSQLEVLCLVLRGNQQSVLVKSGVSIEKVVIVARGKASRVEFEGDAIHEDKIDLSSAGTGHSVYIDSVQIN